MIPIIKSLSVTCALLVSFGWCPAPIVAQETIPIYACVGVPGGADSTVARYQELAEAGFTTSLTGFASVDDALVAMDAAQAAGVTVWVACPELEINPALAANRLKHHPALAGYHIVDEPSAVRFAALADRVRAIQSVDSSHPCYINLFPTYATDSQLGTNGYQEYIDSFVSTVPVPFLSFDYYPTAGGVLDDRVYANLDMVATAGRSVGKRFWGFYQSTMFAPGQPPRTLAELRLECFNDLVYGAQGIQAFDYWGTFPDDREAPIDKDGRRTPTYDLVKTVNHEVASLSRIFLGAENFEVFHAGPAIPAGSRPFAPRGALSGLTFEPVLDARGAVVSYFTNGGSDYVAIVNKDIDRAVRVSVGFCDGAHAVEVRKDGADHGVAGGSFTIEAGDLLLFQVNAPPSVSLTVPTSGVAGIPLTMSATAGDEHGAIAKVEFFVGPVLIGTATTAPYSAIWQKPAPGSYQVTAKATDDLGASTVSPVTVVTIEQPTTGDGAGLSAAYFAKPGFAGIPVTRTDACVDFDWGTGSPATGIGADGFSVRWTGQVQAQFSETYTFTTVSDDGVRLWVNDQPLVDNWTDHPPTENSGAITLVAGQKYNLKMEFYENGGGAVARLSWASPSTAKQIIPKSQLYPVVGPPLAYDDAVSTAVDQSVAITLRGTDPGGDALAFAVQTAPQHGRLSGSAPALTYTPDSGFSGDDALTFLVSGSHGPSAIATVRIAVLAVAPTRPDLGFEHPSIATFVYTPSGSAWAFERGAGLTADRSNFSAGLASVPEGRQAAFVQQDGAFAQRITGFTAGDAYVIRFQAAQRVVWQASSQDFRVDVDGHAVGVFRPAAGGWQWCATAAFIATGDSALVRFVGLDSNGGDNTAFIDDVRIEAVPDAADPDLGFESPAIGAYAYRPTGTPWAFDGNAGVTANGSGFTRSNPPAPQGRQVAFLQTVGSFSQHIGGLFPGGTYTLRFRAAQRANWQTSSQDFRVLVDGREVGVFRPDGVAYQEFATNSFIANGHGALVRFVGIDSNGGDNTAFIDDLRLEQAVVSGLIGHWRFDERTGVIAADSSGNRHDGVVTRGNWTVGPRDGALAFDGTGSARIDGVPALGAQPFTVALWLRLDRGADGTWRSVIHKGDEGGQRTFAMWMQPASNRLHVRVSTTAWWDEGFQSTAELVPGRWTHIAYVVSGGALALYLDGRLDNRVVLGGAVVPNAGPVWVGKDPWDNGAAGGFDDVRIYDHALSASEIADLVAGTAPAVPTGPG